MCKKLRVSRSKSRRENQATHLLQKTNLTSHPLALKHHHATAIPSCQLAILAMHLGVCCPFEQEPVSNFRY